MIGPPAGDVHAPLVFAPALLARVLKSALTAIVGIGLHSPIHGAAVLGFPTNKEEAKARARALVETYAPAAVVTIEKGGMNDHGYLFGTRGTELVERGSHGRDIRD